VRFGDDSALEVGVEGAGALLVAGADGGAPTVFEGASEGAARWLGVTFGARMDLARSAFRDVRVRGAGAPSGAVVGGCGCALDVRGDAACLTTEGLDVSQIVSNVRLEQGFSRGVGVASRGVFAAPPRSLVSPGRVDVSGAGVACAELRPRVAGHCASDRAVNQ
jgi:hypothetical protein